MLYVFAVHNNIEAPLRGSIFAERSGFLNISELHQRNWYLAQYIPCRQKPRTSLFPAFRTTRPSLDTPDTEKKSAARIKSVVTVDIYTPCFPVTFFLKADPERHNFTHLRRHSAFLNFVKMAGEIKTVREDIVQSLMKVYPDPALNPAARGGAGCCLHPLADKSALPVPPPA